MFDQLIAGVVCVAIVAIIAVAGYGVYHGVSPVEAAVGLWHCIVGWFKREE